MWGNSQSSIRTPIGHPFMIRYKSMVSRVLIQDEDSKSDSRKGVTVQVRSAAPLYSVNFSFNFFFF